MVARIRSKKALTKLTATGTRAAAGGATPVHAPMSEQILFANVQAGMEPEFLFHEYKKWRFDWAWEGKKVALEREGGTWQGGRHVSGEGFRDDLIKYNEAALAGWIVIRFTVDMERSGIALEQLIRALDSRSQ